MSVVCVPHNFAVIRLDEGNEVKIVKKRQLRLKAFANGASCRLIVHDGVPRNAKIVRTFTTGVEAKTYLDNINTAKQSWGFTTKALYSAPLPEPSTSAPSAQPNRTNICESKGLSDSIILSNADSLVQVVKNHRPVSMPFSADRKRHIRGFTQGGKVTMEMVQGLIGMTGIENSEDDQEVDDQEDDSDYAPLSKLLRQVEKSLPSTSKPRREMTYDLSGLVEADSGLSESSNPSNSSPDCASDNSNDEAPMPKPDVYVKQEPVDICSTALSLLPKILQSIEKQTKVIEEFKRDHEGLKKTISNVSEFFGELEETKVIDTKRDFGVDCDVLTLGLTRSKVEMLYINTCSNPLGFFQLLCRLVFAAEPELSWACHSNEQRHAIENIVNHYFPSPNPTERLERFVQKVFEE